MSKRSSDPRLAELRALFAAHTDTEHAAFHKNYHKSTKKFYGLRAAKLTELVKHVFPARQKLQKEDVFSLADELWVSEWFEEQVVAIMLVERIVKDLTPADLPHLKMFADGSDGWATLDHFSTRILGPLAMKYPDEVYPKVYAWRKSKHLWTRRASILIHVWPARKNKLNAEYALPTFVELLHEKEFFIRKAIGWALREMCKHYPEAAFEFIHEHKAEMSGLTLREGSRSLPQRLKAKL